MELNYEITKEDYIQFYRYQVNYSKIHKNYYNRLKYWTPTFFIIVLFALGIGFFQQSIIFLSSISFLFLIFWFYRFPKTYQKTSRKHALKILNDGDYASMLGKRELLIKDDKIKISNGKMTSIVNMEAITDLVIYADMILVYANKRNAMLVPTRYLTPSEQESLIETINSSTDVTLDYQEDKQDRLVNSKTLFLLFIGVIALVLISFTSYQIIRYINKEEPVINADGSNRLLPKEMAPEDLPQEKVFEDEHTRSFIQSTEESRPGHYPFLSATGAYEMDLPKDSQIINNAFFSSFLSWILNEEQEDLIISIKNPDDLCQHNLIVTYQESQTVEDLKEGIAETILQKKKHLSLEEREVEIARLFADQFEQIDQGNQTIYLEEPFESVSNPSYEDPKDTTEHYSYSAYFFKNPEPGGIHVSYSGFCVGECEERRAEALSIMYDWLLVGIRFVDETPTR